jgi:hypothetical protein
MNRKLFFIVPLLVIIDISLNWRKAQIKWVAIFKLDKIFVQYNSQGNLNGEIVRYKEGKIYVLGNVVNGVKQGWETMFYKNGKIESRTFFVNGLPAGKGYLYSPDGNLAYSGNYKYGKPYGSWYQYYADGHVKKYMLYDIDKLDKATSFTIGYETNGNLKLKEMSGFVVSPNFYSINSINNAIIPLFPKNNPIRKFNNINDLYITVANPEHAKLSAMIKVNKSQYTFNGIKSNTIKIVNAFSKKGKYDLFIESHLYDENDKVINGINMKVSLVKE